MENFFRKVVQMMNDFIFLVKNFFTHKDFLPPSSALPGTLFTPLHFIFSACCLLLVIFGGIALSKKDEKVIRGTFAAIWITVTCLEVCKIVWETYSGSTVNLELGGILPLYPCSIFMYAMPLAIFGRGVLRRMGCGYICTLGFLGGSINFVYPATVLGDYSCFSLAGFQTFFFHGAMVFCTLVMLLSGYHSYKEARKPVDLLIPAVPALCVSVIANIVNFSSIGSDYMFFRMSSFFFAPIGAALPTPVCVIIVYVIYLIIHALPYLPFYFKNVKEGKKEI